MAQEPAIQYQGVQDVQSLLEQLPQSVFEDTKTILREAVLTTQREVKARFKSGPLHTRTGEAERSFKTELSGTTLENLKASVFSGAVGGAVLVYVPVHEFGAQGTGAITAKNAYRSLPGGPYLNIPLSANLTPAGVMREDARDVFNHGGFIFGTQSTGFFVARFDGVPMFVLKKKVEIKPRLGMYKTADEQADIAVKKLSDLLPESWRSL